MLTKHASVTTPQSTSTPSSQCLIVALAEVVNQCSLTQSDYARPQGRGKPAFRPILVAQPRRTLTLHGMPRLFLALALPDALRADLVGLQAPTAHGVAWAPQAQLHLTLRFIGDVPVPSLAALEDSLATIRVASFILPLAGVGAFPPRGQPQVLWAGVQHAHPHLFQLRQQVDDRLLALGFDADLKTFHPHATLARLHRDASPGFAAEWLRRHREWEGPPFRATSFGLYTSQLTPTGALHTRLREYPLA